MNNSNKSYNEILKLISKYVGKKYIYILPIAYQEHEENRNINDWKNRVNNVLTSCNIPCFITYGNYQCTAEAYWVLENMKGLQCLYFFVNHGKLKSLTV